MIANVSATAANTDAFFHSSLVTSIIRVEVDQGPAPVTQDTMWEYIRLGCQSIVVNNAHTFTHSLDQILVYTLN